VGLGATIGCEEPSALKGRALSKRFKYMGRIQVALGAMAAAISASLKADPADVAKHLGESGATILQSLQDWAWLFVPACLLLAALVGHLRKRFGDPAMWGFVHELLNDFRNKIFSDAGSEYQHHHRVTLFKHSRWVWCVRRWPWSGWLKPIERSGHTTQSSRALFRAPDNSDDCEGIAGLAWCANGALKVDKLPDLNSAEALQDYSKRTGVTVSYLQENLPKSRSFYAVRVEVKGDPWGVLVIDSRKDTFNFRRVNTH